MKDAYGALSIEDVGTLIEDVRKLHDAANCFYIDIPAQERVTFSARPSL